MPRLKLYDVIAYKMKPDCENLMNNLPDPNLDNK